LVQRNSTFSGRRPSLSDIRTEATSSVLGESQQILGQCPSNFALQRRWVKAFVTAVATRTTRVKSAVIISSETSARDPWERAKISPKPVVVCTW
jgi:hypothetical protein